MIREDELGIVFMDEDAKRPHHPYDDCHHFDDCKLYNQKGVSRQ